MTWLQAGLGRTLALVGIVGLGAAGPADRCTDDAMLVFDGSGSMSEMGFNQLDQPRILEAREAVRRAIPPVAARRRLGLIVYGPGSDEDACRNVVLHFPPVAGAGSRVISTVDALAPAGNTPLTEAVRRAAEVLGPSGAIVVVTDGKETCGGAPCSLAARLSNDAPGIEVHVIGFKVRGDFFTWDSQGPRDEDGRTVARCLADATGGRYFATETVEQLAGALGQALGCPIVALRGEGRVSP